MLDARAAAQIDRGDRLAKARAKDGDEDTVWFRPSPRLRKPRLPPAVGLARFTKKHTPGRLRAEKDDAHPTTPLVVEYLHIGMTL